MEFSLTCPNDGTVELSLEDISAVVMRSPESIDIVFTCPHCGSRIDATLQVPNLLSIAMELAQYAEQISEEESGLQFVNGPLADDGGHVAEADPSAVEHADSYCEYFRRQLEHIECVEDLLAEIDSR